MPSKIFICIIKYPVDISLDKVKTIVGRVFADTLQQLRGYTLSLHLRCNHKTEYGFYFNVCMIFLYGPIRTQIINTELTILVCIAPTHDFIPAISEIALQVTCPDKLNGTLPSFLTRGEPVVAVTNIRIVTAPCYTIAFTAACVDIMGRHVKEAGIILRKVRCKSTNFNIYFFYLLKIKLLFVISILSYLFGRGYPIYMLALQFLCPQMCKK